MSGTSPPTKGADLAWALVRAQKSADRLWNYRDTLRGLFERIQPVTDQTDDVAGYVIGTDPASAILKQHETRLYEAVLSANLTELHAVFVGLAREVAEELADVRRSLASIQQVKKSYQPECDWCDAEAIVMYEVNDVIDTPDLPVFNACDLHMSCHTDGCSTDVYAVVVHGIGNGHDALCRAHLEGRDNLSVAFRRYGSIDDWGCFNVRTGEFEY